MAHRNTDVSYKIDLEVNLRNGVRPHDAPLPIQQYLSCSQAAVKVFEVDPKAVMEEQPRCP